MEALATTAVAGATALAISAASASAAVTIELFSLEPAGVSAGAHADLSTTFAFRTVYGPHGAQPAGGSAADFDFALPPGVVGDIQSVPECPRELFDADSLNSSGEGGCPPNTQVGVAEVTIAVKFLGGVPHAFRFGVYNVEPGPDQAAMLGLQDTINAVGVTAPVLISLDPKDNYAIRAVAREAQRYPVEGDVLGARVTLWGVPQSHARRDGGARGEGEVTSLAADPAGEWHAFMENPTDCAGSPFATLAVNTYEELNVFASATAVGPRQTECGAVPFEPSINTQPDTELAGVPAGLGFALTVPQNPNPDEQNESEMESASVTLPPGMTISPSAASMRLEGCTDAQFAAESSAPAQCPPASVIGEDEVESPLVLSRPLNGKVYLGQPSSTDPNSGKMFRVFQELQGQGLDVKIEGSVVANPVTGQLTASFSNLPELPFQRFRLHLRGGPNAVLVNPQSCGPQMTTAKLSPYSNPTVPATPSSTFTTSYDRAGTPCPEVLPFALSAGVASASTQAGALSPTTFTLSRSDETQPLGRIEVKLPPGLLGYVSKVALCEPAQAEAGNCNPASRIGKVTAAAGAGPDPLSVEGSVYLAHGSEGYPFMLSVVVPAVAGPYDLGNVVVPVWVQVNSDGSISAVSGSLPSILDGIPLDIRSIMMTLDRPGFMSNPTNCSPFSLTGQATSLAGSLAALSAPFEVSGCSSLAFTPSFTAATRRTTSKLDGASLTVRVSQPTGQANIRYVRVQLPRSMPSRLTTLQQACTAAQFESNPAGCPAASIVGTASAYTPMLPTAISGPTILVSHGGGAFPDLHVLLQGDGLTIDLVGNTDIKNGITTSTFASVPDAPISGFELSLPEGPYSALSANGNLCRQTLTMPTTIASQSGAKIAQNTRIAVAGCAPTVHVTQAKVRAGNLALTVRASAPGLLRLSGVGSQTVTQHVRSGVHSVMVSLTRAGKIAIARHRTVELRVTLIAARQVVTTSTSVKL